MILVAGVGNVLLGDDGFGVEVIRRLSGQPLPSQTAVADFGIRGMHLAYELLEGYDTLILVDAMARSEAPGTLYVMEPDVTKLPQGAALDAHRLDPATVLATVRVLGGSVARTIVVGCEPSNVEEGIGLSEPVARAVVEIDAGRLKSGHGLIDGELQRRLDTRKFPRVWAAVKEVEALPSGRWRLRGDLSLHGIANATAADVTVQIIDDHTIEVEGEKVIDMRQWGLTPPRFLMLKVEPEVKVRARIRAERQA